MMKGIWEGGFTESKKADVLSSWKFLDLAKDLRELASKLKAISKLEDALDKIVEENVEAALKEYAKEAQTDIMADPPGVFEVCLWYGEGDRGTLAKIQVDIRKELTEWAETIKDGGFDDEEMKKQRKAARAWAETLEQLALILREI